MSLLERAKSRYRGGVDKEPTKEDLELALAWLNFEIGTSDVAFALYEDPKKCTAATQWIAQRLRDAIKANKISISIVGGKNEHV